MTITYNAAQLLTDLKVDEGVMLKPYKDTAGKITIGIGRNLTDDGISQAEMLVLYNTDIMMVTTDLDADLTWWREKPDNVQRVLINLCFNMGWTKLSAFHTFLQLIEQDDIEGAIADLEGTAWFGEVGLRGPRMVARLRNAGGNA